MLRAYGRFVSRHPWWVLLVLAVVSVGLLQGVRVRHEAPPTRMVEAFLPAGSAFALAQDRLAADFPLQAGLTSIQVVFRGNVLTAEGLRQTREAVEAVVSDPLVAELRAGSQPLLSPGHLVPLLAPDGGVDGMSPFEIAAMLSIARDIPEAQVLMTAIDSVVARDGSGAVVGGLGLVTLFDPGDPDAVRAAQLAADEVVAGYPLAGLEASTVSSALVERASEDTVATSTPFLMALAMAVIVAILLLFYRTVSDVILSMAGLGLTIGWTLGFQAWLGPGGLGWIGDLDTLEILVPVALIGLSVDFALQITSRYRDALDTGEEPAPALGGAVTRSGTALLLAAGTTAVAFLTNVTNTIPPIRYFGVVAAAGVIFGLLVMSSLVPAGRVILDRWRVRGGRRVVSGSLDDALPGLVPFIGRVAEIVVGRPLVVLVLVAGVTVAAALELPKLETTFDQTDLLPSGDLLDDIEFLQDGLGGRSEVVTVLVEVDLSSDRTLRDLIDLEIGLVDVNRRPDAASGPVIQSLISLIRDWSEDSGLPGDEYDPAFRVFLEELDTSLLVPPETVNLLYSELHRIDPEGLAAVAVFREGPDATIVQFPARTGDQDASRRLIEQIERLWFGEDDAITALGDQILAVTITDELTSSQTRGVGITLGVTLALLLLYFGFTHFRPLLGLFAVLPIAVVVIWVLGSMVVLGISYNAVTALITALIIGVGVDYTIHLTHRFLEERQKTHSLTVAMRSTMLTTGGALIGSALTTALGFAVLLIAPLTPMRQFGVLTALTILYSLIAAFVILPPTLTLWAIYHRWRDQAFSGDPDRAQHSESAHPVG